MVFIFQKAQPSVFLQKGRLLEIGIKSNKINLVKLLLEMGADPETWINFRTVLDMAAERKDPQFAQILLEHGAKHNDEHLLNAVSKGFEKAAGVSIKAGVNVNARIGDRKYTAPMAACGCSPSPHDPTLPQRLVHLLLSNGADAHVEDDKGITAFDLAFKNTNSHVLKLLLEWDKRLGASNSSGGTVWLQQYLKKHFSDTDLEMVGAECLNLLLKRAAIDQPDDNNVMLKELVKTACTSRNWKAFNCLVEKVIEFPILDDTQAGLIKAVGKLNTRVVEILMGRWGEREVCPQQRSLFQVALWCLEVSGESDSAKERFHRIWQTLLLGGEDINAVDEDQYTPLAYIAEYADDYTSQTELIQLCIDSGADIYHLPFGIWCPILMVAFNGSPTSLRCLMTHAAKQPRTEHWLQLDDWNADMPLEHDLEVICRSLARSQLLAAQDEEGQTLVQRAAELNNERLTSQLLKHGADVNTADSDGYKLLHNACLNGHAAVVKVLLDHGAGALDAVNNWKWDADQLDLPTTIMRDPYGMNGVRPEPPVVHWEFQPLHFASRRGHVDVVKLLVSHRADLDAGTKLQDIYVGFEDPIEGRLTPLHVSLGSGCRWILKTLDMEEERKERNFKVAELLIDGGASVHGVADDFDERDIALFEGHEDLWNKLRSGITTDWALRDPFQRDNYPVYCSDDSSVDGA